MAEQEMLPDTDTIKAVAVDEKWAGYTKTDIIRYYELRDEKPLNRPIISKYCDMDVVPPR